MIIIVPWKTSIPYSKNGLMRELFNVFIISSFKYLDNLINMPTDLDIFRDITSTRFLNVRCLSKIIPKNLLLLVSSTVADEP